MTIGRTPIVRRQELAAAESGSVGYDALQITDDEGIGITCFRGYDLYTAAGPQREENVFYIDDHHLGRLDSLQKQDFAGRVLAEALEQARQDGFELVRMHVIDPLMINLLDYLHGGGQTRDTAYITEPGGELQPQRPSSEVLSSGARLTSEQARALLQEGQEPGADGVLCVMAL